MLQLGFYRACNAAVVSAENWAFLKAKVDSPHWQALPELSALLQWIVIAPGPGLTSGGSSLFPPLMIHGAPARRAQPVFVFHRQQLRISQKNSAAGLT
jgi:hypothetical protein